MPRVVRDYKETARSQIIEAALEVFSSKGYFRSTMDDIAKRLGVSKGALYLYFKSKEDLLREIQASSREKVREQLREAFEDQDPVKGAGVFFDNVFQGLAPSLNGVFDTFSLAVHDEKLGRILREDHEKDVRIIEEFLDEQTRKGTISPKIEKHLLAQLFIGISFVVLVDLALGYEKSTVRKKWVESITAILGAHRRPSS